MRFSQRARVIKVRNVTSSSTSRGKSVITNVPQILPTVTPTITPSETPPPSFTPTISVTPTTTPTISVTPSITPTVTPTVSPSGLPPSATPAPTSTRTPTPTYTPTPSTTNPGSPIFSLAGNGIDNFVENIGQKVSVIFLDANSTVYFYNNWDSVSVLPTSTIIRIGGTDVANISHTTDRIGQLFGYSLSGTTPEYFGALTNGSTVTF